MSRFHNKTYEQKINKMEYTAPSEVVNAIYNNGGFVSSACNGRYVTVNRVINGKVHYMGMLKNYVKESATMYRDGDSRNVTLANLK